MTAGFEGHISRSVTSLGAGRLQSMDFSVSFTGALMPAFADKQTIFDDNAADPWIRRGGIQPLLGQT